jgi:hypothetical protein
METLYSFLKKMPPHGTNQFHLAKQRILLKSRFCERMDRLISAMKIKKPAGRGGKPPLYSVVRDVRPQ